MTWCVRPLVLIIFHSLEFMGVRIIFFLLHLYGNLVEINRSIIFPAPSPHPSSSFLLLDLNFSVFRNQK